MCLPESFYTHQTLVKIRFWRQDSYLDQTTTTIVGRDKVLLGVVHILRNQPRGGGFQMLTVDYGGGGVWSLIT